MRILILLLLSQSVFATPESEIYRLKNIVYNLDQQLLKDLHDYERPDKQNLLKEAEFWVKQKRWQTVIELLENFTFQNDEMQLRRLYALGKSYEAIQPQKSIQFYKQYLNIAQNVQPIPSHFTSAIDRLLRASPLSQQGSTISSILSLNLTKDVRHKVLLLTSGIALEQSKLSMAKTWLQSIIKQDPDTASLAQSLYFMGVISALERDFSRAIHFFDTVQGVSDPAQKVWRERANLATAHIYQDQKKHKSALKFYKKIDENSSFYSKALDGIIRNMIHRKSYTELTPYIEQRLTYPGRKMHYQKLMSWVDIQIGETERARKSIKSMQEELQKDKRNILFRTQKKYITSEDFYDLSQDLKKWFPHTPETEKLEDVFTKKSEIDKKIFGLKSRLKNLYTLHHYLGPNKTTQHISNQQFQISKIAEQTLITGFDFIQATREQLKTQMDSPTYLKLGRIKESFHTNQEGSIQKEFQKWIKLKEITQQIQIVANIKQRVEKIEAQLAGIAFYAKQHPTLSEPEHLSSYQDNLTSIRTILQESAQHLKTHKTYALANVSPTFYLSKRLFQNLRVIEESWSQLASIIKKDQTPLGTLKFKKNIDFYMQWSNLAGRLLHEISRLSTEKKQILQAHFKKMESFRNTINTLAQTSHHLQKKIERSSGTVLVYLSRRFEEKFQKVEADLLKWEGDMAHQRFLQISKKQQETQKAIRIEEELLLPTAKI